jgi:putative endonuclease
MAAHNELGTWGEAQAEEYLRRKGYLIMERDWHFGHRDLDLVAMDGTTVVFVEVKTRSSRLFAEPEQAVGWRKVKHLKIAAGHYVKQHCIDGELRFDIVTVVGTMGQAPEIDHIEDAF